MADTFYVYESRHWQMVHTYREFVVDAPLREQTGWVLFLDSLPVNDKNRLLIPDLLRNVCICAEIQLQWYLEA
jgi:hypothetical protein